MVIRPWPFPQLRQLARTALTRHWEIRTVWYGKRCSNQICWFVGSNIRTSRTMLCYRMTLWQSQRSSKTFTQSSAKNANGEMPLVSEIVDNPAWAHLVSTVDVMDHDFIYHTDQKTGLRDPTKQFNEFFENRLSRDDPLAETLARFQLFHTPPTRPALEKNTRKDGIETQWLGSTQTKMPEPEDLGKQLDFHQIIAAMNPYPSMLRRLGIVVDLILDVTLFKKAPD